MPSFIWDAIASTYRDLQGGSTPGGPSTDPESTEAPQFGSVPVGAASYAVPTSNVIWVATTGNDTSGTGSSAAPYRTVGRALSVAPANSTVVVRGGVYEEGGKTTAEVPNAQKGRPNTNNELGKAPSVAVRDNITLQNAPGEEVWIDGSVAVTGWTSSVVSGKTVWRAPYVQESYRVPSQNLDYTDPTSNKYAPFCVVESPIAHWHEMCLRDGVPLEQVATLAEVGPGKFYVEGTGYASKFAGPKTEQVSGYAYGFTSSAYVIGDNPNGHEIRISRYSRALNCGSASSATQFTLRGIGFRRYASCLLDSGSLNLSRSNTTLENVVVEDVSGGPGVYIGGSDSRINKCTIRRCGIMGLELGTVADNPIVENSRFTENNYRLFNYGPWGGAIKGGRAEGAIVRKNWFDSTLGHALWFDECVIKATIHGNLFTKNWGIGVIYEISDTALIADNIFIDNGLIDPNNHLGVTSVSVRQPHNCPAISVSGSNRVRIWHNTIVNSEVGIKVSQDPRQPVGDPAGSWGWHNPKKADSWYLENCSWDVKEFESCNNAIIGCAGKSTTESVFMRMGGTPDIPAGSAATPKASLPRSGFRLDGNLYNRTGTKKPERFAISYVTKAVKVHENMTITNTDSPDQWHRPESWKALVGEAGSVLVTNTTPWVNAGQARIGAHSATPVAVPSDVAALLAASPWTGQQSVGAGYTVLPQ